jgi:flagellar hook-associated protein 2
VAASTVTGTNLQRQYVSRATTLESLNNGRGVGTGSFRITDAVGATAVIDVTTGMRTVGDLLNQINGKGLKITARINRQGDGIEIVEDVSQSPAGTIKMKVEDTAGTVAKALNLAGTASDVGSSNRLDGSFERTVTLSAADTLQQVIDKINAAGAGVTAAAVRDGNGSTPYRLSLSSATTGVRGRFIVDSGAFDLGLQTLEAGRDALVFYGSSDPARGVAVTSSTNTIDSVLPGVKIDLRGRSNDPVNLTISTDTDGIVASVNAFLQAFNTVTDRIATQTKYDQTTQKGGALLGDGTVIELRSALFNTIQAAGIGTSGRFRSLSDIGVKIGSGGTLTLDQDRFRAALQEDPASVESLFTARTVVDDAEQDVPGYPGVRVRNPNAGNTFSTLGVMGQFEQLVTRYIDASSGVLTGRTQGLDAQIKLQQARVQAFTDRLSQRQTILERQFQAMESAIGKMQTQQSALSSISKVG